MSNNELESSLELDLGPFRKALDSALTQVRRFGDQMKNALDGATRGLNNSSNGMNKFSNDVNRANNEVKKLAIGMRDLERIVGGIMLSQAFYGAKTGIENAAVALTGFMNDMEKAQIALEYFLATPEQAKAFLADMQDFAATTSFSTQQALALSRKLMAAQFNPNAVRPTMEILNDASAAAGGTAEQMDRIVLALTQIKTNGKLAGQEMRQLAEAGIPIYKIIQEELGLSGEQVMNVGDLKINGDKAVEAVLRGLEKRYKGAADRIADTVPGMWQTIEDDSKMLGQAVFKAPYDALKRFLTTWRDTWEEARNLMVEGGLGRVLENMIPQELWTSIRAISGSIKSLGRSFVTLLSAMKPVAQVMAGSLITALGVAMPILAGLAKAISQLAEAAIQTVPGLKYLIAAVLGLLVAQGVARVMMFFWGVLRLGTIAAVVAKAVNMLAAAMIRLSMAILRNPVVLGIVAIAGAILYFTGAAKQALGWIDALINRLAGLGGFDIDLQLPNVDSDIADIDDYMSKWGDAAGKVEDSTDDMKDSAGKAEKAFKKFAASFDELYQIPEKNDAGSGSGGSGIPGGLPGLDVGPGAEFEPWQMPKEIELPKLKWPSLDDIELPPIIAKWLGGNFKWPEWPKFPPFPPLPALSWDLTWQTAIDALKLKWENLKGWVSGWELPPIQIPVPSLQPVLDAIAGWQPLLIPAWQGVWESLPWPDFSAKIKEMFNPIPLVVGEMVTAASLMFADMVANFGKSMGQIGEAISSLGTWFSEGWSAAWNATTEWLASIGTSLSDTFAEWGDWGAAFFGALLTGFLAMWQGLFNNTKSWGTSVKNAFGEVWTGMGTAVSTAIAGIMTGVTDFLSKFKINWSTGWTDAKKFLGDKLGEMKTLWDNHKGTIITVAGALLAGVALAFSGGLSGIIAGIVAWGPRVVKIFKDLLPAISLAVKGLPKIFKDLWDDIVKALPTVIDNIVKPFKDLPDKIWKGVKGIAGKVNEAFANIKLPTFKSVGEAITATFSRLGDVAGFETGGIIGKDSIVRVGEKGKREAIIPLQNQTAMQPFVDAVVQGIGGTGGRGRGTGDGSPQGDDRPIVYVANLIADDRSLRELDQRIQMVRMNRGGGGRVK